jgi:small-conductance mechanosensitive channel
MDRVLDILNLVYVKPLIIIVGSIVAAYVVEWIFRKVILKLTSKTATSLDDEVVEHLKRPVVLSIVFVGIALAVQALEIPKTASFVSFAMLKTLAVWVWALAAGRVGTTVLKHMSHSESKQTILQRRTLPFFDIMVKLVVIGWAIYFGLLAWNVNVTGWLASAGVVGIAVGFAAKDTLANLFAGIFILADSPYKLGDMVVVDSDLRGNVTQIGIRSTRVVTRDGIEITVPNALIGNGKIINESGGKNPNERIRATVFVAYGSNIEQVREVLLKCADGVAGICPTPVPEVRLRELGDSGLRFQLLVWIYLPEDRGTVLDQINTRIYNALRESGIEIPYGKQDLYIKEMPSIS